MTKKLTPQQKKDRKPASRACVFCHRKHLQCSNERPCKNCVKRKIGHECQDVLRKRAKYMHINSKSRDIEDDTSNNENDFLSSNGPNSTVNTPLNVNNISMNSHDQIENKYEPPLPIIEGTSINNTNFEPIVPRISKTNSNTNTMLNTTNDVLNRLLLEQNLSTNTSNIISPTDLNHNESTIQQSISNNSSNINFSSNYLNQEYLMLGDIILQSKPSSPSPSNTSVSEYNNPSNELNSPATFLSPANNLIQQNKKVQDHQSKRKLLKDSRPFIALGFSNSALSDPKNDSSIADFLDHSTTNNAQSNNNDTGNATVASTANNSSTNLQSSSNPFLPKLGISSGATTEYISPLVTHHLYQTVQDIYTNNIISYEYPHSYHSLTYFLKKRFSGNNLSPEEKQAKRNNLLIILKLIASYRPTFISAHKSLLKPYDLQFLEMCFQRSLIDYEKLSHLNSSPTIIWRRTGEVVSITDDLLSLLGYNLADILSKRTFIMELMFDDESIINYFKLFKSIAIGNLNSSIFTKCKLTKNLNKILETSSTTPPLTSHGIPGNSDGDESNLYIEFCSVWTVKRDLFDLPMLIIGQFLPILPAGDGVRMY
ncbi:zinc finger transcription factor [Scheffersomyces amazonensis]|uniref:zinc finger transcription factor n=1 Tax=Scheffersomyces amazonensis TaxID=1078765 RepID=UPI00315C5556